MQPQTLDLDLDFDLPGSQDLPCSDDTPVDNENQNKLPNWLLGVLDEIWGDRDDWFFGIDMGIYDPEHQRKRTPIVIPDGFLSIGVESDKRRDLGRLSYVLREENNIPPILALEMVSQTYGDEYGSKFERYGRLGVKYYVIYNREYSRRDKHEPFEVYKLIEGAYERQEGEPYWMEEVGLGIGRVRGRVKRLNREWLGWHDRQGTPYPLPSQMLEQKNQQLEQKDQQRKQKEQQVAQKRRKSQQKDQLIREKVRSLGIDPEQLI